ncbi:hypothetical protein GCM10007913_21640 [Devosia yakushimensis]|uniref:Uncharacterized protein n=1 Tax=Devosia yakushimensis TaxID=470028 RepID=A0ABQ5UDS0_9HYPH|nr:hypothetical protein GCM10007913_21640 [Devosia yakushimensis]
MIVILGAAIDLAGSQQLGHSITRRATARPWPAPGVVAGLSIFGGIDAEQTDALIAKAETIAIAGAGIAGNWWRRRIEPGRDHRCAAEQNNHQHGSKAPAKGSHPTFI